MSNISKSNRQAVDWFLSRKYIDWTRSDEAAFLEWCSKEDNFIKHQKFEETWDTLDGLVKDQPHVAILSSRKKDRFINSKIKWVASFAAVAATLAIVLINQFSQPENIYTVSLQTMVGQQKTYTLKDGSIITLNTDSKLDVSFADQKRSITLDQGQAFFEVAKDPERPFIVSAGITATQAIGTKFDVYRMTDGNIRISVVEGIVEVTHPNATNNIKHHLAQQLTKDEILTVTPQLAATKTVDGKLENQLSWKVGVLDFNASPLENVIFEVNRYGQKKIIIKDDRIKSFEVSGIFKISDLDTFVSTIKNILPINVVDSKNSELYLRTEDTQK